MVRLEMAPETDSASDMVTCKILTKSMEHEMYMKLKSTGSWCLLVEYANDNYFARFHTHSY